MPHQFDLKRPFNLKAKEIGEAIVAGFFPNLCYLTRVRPSPIFFLPFHKITATPHLSTAYSHAEGSSWALFAKYMTTSERSYIYSLSPMDASLLTRRDLIPEGFFQEVRPLFFSSSSFLDTFLLDALS